MSYNRRDFLKDLPRLAIASLAGVAALKLLLDREDSSCIHKVPYCKSCRKVANCKQVEALAYRDWLSKNNLKEKS